MDSTIDDKKPERFWRGDIETKSHAEKIVAYTAGGFSIFGVLGLLAAFTPSFDLSRLLTALIFLVPAYSLHKSKSLVAARVLLGLSSFAFLATVAAWNYLLSSTADHVLLFLVFPLILCSGLFRYWQR
jgi:hypothetical protein